MGREVHETTVVCSSIALLQERFRQLERVKEMREERELLRVHSEPNNATNTQCFFNNLNNPAAKNCEKPSRLFFHPDLIFPRRTSTSSQQAVSDLTSLCPTFHSDQYYYYYYCSSAETPQLFTRLWHLDASVSSPFQASSGLGLFGDSHDETDVDTSLHL